MRKSFWKGTARVSAHARKTSHPTRSRPWDLKALARRNVLGFFFTSSTLMSLAAKGLTLSAASSRNQQCQICNKNCVTHQQTQSHGQHSVCAFWFVTCKPCLELSLCDTQRRGLRGATRRHKRQFYRKSVILLTSCGLTEGETFCRLLITHCPASPYICHAGRESPYKCAMPASYCCSKPSLRLKILKSKTVIWLYYSHRSCHLQ